VVAAVETPLAQAFRDHWGRVVATLIGLLGDFERAEEAAQEAFAIAAERWPADGIPDNPSAWLITTARRRAIDRIRRERVLAEKTRELEAEESSQARRDQPQLPPEDPEFPDERLELIFTCCHPALVLESQVALTLRTLGGLTTTEIANAFLVPEPTMAQRLVRAKRKITAAGIPFRVPEAAQLSDRLAAVLAVVYLIFNTGYSTPPARGGLSREAIRLGVALAELMPNEAEVHGLLALMLLNDSRRAARVRDGELVLLSDQDRSLWDPDQIERGRTALDRALAMHGHGRYVVQAAIASLHLERDRDWPQIAALYGRLSCVAPSPVVELNRAVAVALAEGPERGLELIDSIGGLDGYRHLHSARADLLRRLGRGSEAAESYGRALELATQPAERAFLERRLAEVQ
jgi:RNA polymerase sigma-70 factor (ECF subfamily)